VNPSDIKKTTVRWIKKIRTAFLCILIFIDDQRQEAIDFLAPIISRLPPLKKFFGRRNSVIRYIYKVLNTAIEAFFLIFATWFICFILMYLADIMWRLYLETPMGNKFLTLFHPKAQTIAEIFEMDHLYFTIELTVASFAICLVLGAVCHFLHISHYLYHSRGFLGKLLFWGIPLTAVVAYYIKNAYGFSDWEVSCAITVVPTYLLFISCFTYSQSLLPEAGEVIDAVVLNVKKIYRFILKKYFLNKNDEPCVKKW